jgi:hypothetical protein
LANRFDGAAQLIHSEVTISGGHFRHGTSRPTYDLGNNWQRDPGGDHATDTAVPKIVKPDGT